MEDEDGDEDTTLEEIISSVLKTKSKCDKMKWNLPPLPRRRTLNIEKEDCSQENKGASKAKTEELRSYLMQSDKTGGGGNTSSLTSLDQASGKLIGRRDAIHSKEDLDTGSCGAHHGSWSTSKMKHSFSTPEIRNKYIQTGTTTQGKDDAELSVIQQINFSRVSCNSNILGNKENSDPIAVRLDRIKERSTTTLDAVNKDLPQKSSELSKVELKPSSNFVDKNSEVIREGIGPRVYSTQFHSMSKAIKKPLSEEVSLENDEDFLSARNGSKENDQIDKSGSLHRQLSSQLQNGHTNIKSHVSSFQKQANVSSSHETQNIAADQERHTLKLTVTTASGTNTIQNTAYVKTAPTCTIKSGHSVATKDKSPQAIELSLSSSEGSQHGSQARLQCRVSSSKASPECMQHIVPTSGSQHTTAVVNSHHNTVLGNSQHTTASGSSQNTIVSKTSQNTVPFGGTPCSIVTSDMQHVAHKGISQTNQTFQVLSSKSNVSGGVENSLETPGHSRSVSQQFQTPSAGTKAYLLPPTPPTTQKLKQMDHIVIKGKEYLKLELLGRGGSSKVYEVLDLETRKVKAIKLVNLEGLDNTTLNSYKNEIAILQRLQWSDRVIRLYDHEVSGSHLNLVMEKGNRDLASILSIARNKKASISPFTTQHYWHGMLLAVQAIHQEGIIHSDLKPANFLLVNETVKLIDFGIASSIQQDMTSVIKDSQAGTFNYMSPESLLDIHSGPIISNHSSDRPTIKIGVKSDVWSLGCILYNLVYGRTPFQHITNPLVKLSTISDPNTKINFPDIENKQLKEVMQLCLQFDPRKRPSIQELLEHPYLNAQSSTSYSLTPHKEPHLKRMIDQLAQLTPNSLGKITSMMQQLHPDAKPE